MGLFNVVVAPGECIECGAPVERRVQFTWGDSWLIEYCGAEGPEGDVVIERDVLVAWRPETDVGAHVATLRDASAPPAERVAAAAFLGDADGEPARRALLATGRDASLPPEVADAVGRALWAVERRGYQFDMVDFADVTKRAYDAYCDA